MLFDDRRRVRGHRRGGDLLVPGVVRREKLLAQEREQLARLEVIDIGTGPPVSRVAARPAGSRWTADYGADHGGLPGEFCAMVRGALTGFSEER